MEEINNVCNVQSEIMFVGALYKSPDLYVTYGNFMRPKYDFSDEVVYFFYKCLETYYLKFSQTVDETKLNVFMSQDAERMSNYKKYHGWKTISEFMRLADSNDIKNYFDTVKKYSLVREYVFQLSSMNIASSKGIKHVTDTLTDIIDLVCFCEKLSFPEGLKFICQEVGISYYHDFESDIPESLKILKLVNEMSTEQTDEKEVPLKPIPVEILDYYKPYVNDLFYEDGISYSTQKEFQIGYDTETNRITIPIYSEIGDLVGVKGRLFQKEVDESECKYLYLEKCAKSKILFGLNKTLPYIKRLGVVYVVESEKGVMQLWSYGYKNAVSTGGKNISRHQLDMLIRLGVKIVFCFDKDVVLDDILRISDRLPDGIPAYYMFDKDNQLTGEKESPSDNKDRWEYLLENNVYPLTDRM